MPENPCGKCGGCPCSGSKKDKRPSDQPQPQTPKSPKVECLCVSRRRQESPAPLVTPMADTYTCTRQRPDGTRPMQVPMEERCTCRIKPPPIQCECAPPVEPQAATSYGTVNEDVRPSTRAQIACGQQIPNQQCNQRPQYTPTSGVRCGHCQGQRRSKKCVIQ